ncbi:Diacylglycerol kinase family enzyme [Faunimonas pinastri]|uniref:Diacylglycerol kinase family enzyme n=1 Tax=Faunimonas pinastri TaxID=1855383 RepID=A0A1H9FFM8_9HYPH|nr:diacylglycerol kinase family protein [Faunimonas pinastri]SEQ36118.1 Diacylglycerol kinase family enzyme [Faunimonas pinastri]
MSEDSCPRPMKLTVVLNTNAGTLRGLETQRTITRLRAIFEEAGHEVAFESHAGREAIEAVAVHCRDRTCEGLIIGGGDGSVSAAARAAAGGEVALGILPLGTMNLFARSLGIPLELEASARALAWGTTDHVDIAEVNGRFFVHHVTLGLHPRMIALRERMKYGSRMGKILANIQALRTALRKPPALHAKIRVDGQVIHRRTAAIVVSNNLFGPGHLPFADDPRQGRLGLYVSNSRKWSDLLQLSATVAVGDMAQSPLLERWDGREVEITLDKPRVASVDGEIVKLRPPLHVRIHAGGLKIIQPRR